jgi:hypothetical protein
MAVVAMATLLHTCDDEMLWLSEALTADGIFRVSRA